jgi:hypothetical protein
VRERRRRVRRDVRRTARVRRRLQAARKGCCSVSGLCLEATPSVGSQAHFASNSCYVQGGTATWGTTCVPGDPANCPGGPDGIVCGSCEPAPSEPMMTVCCQESATCTQETVTSAYGLLLRRIVRPHPRRRDRRARDLRRRRPMRASTLAVARTALIGPTSGRSPRA